MKKIEVKLFVWISSPEANRVQPNIPYKTIRIFLVSYLFSIFRKQDLGFKE